MTYKELKRQQAKQKREERKRIEAILHPCPKIGEFEILHGHEGGSIILSAWRDGAPVNRKLLTIPRADVLALGEGFYEHHKNYIQWLMAEKPNP